VLLQNILEGLFAHDAVYDALDFTMEVLKICQSTRANRVLGAEAQHSLLMAAVKVSPSPPPPLPPPPPLTPLV
jgi:hypothetical protein